MRNSDEGDLSVPLPVLSTAKSVPFGAKYTVIKDITITLAMIPKIPRPKHINIEGIHDGIVLKKEKMNERK
jgi:hypothetical protein